MKKENTYNQEINEEEKVFAGEGCPSNEGTPCDNVAEEAQQATDNVAEPTDEEPLVEPEHSDEKEEEQIDWRDKYIRLQAEFDNFRKRTLREKMDLIQTGGSDVLKAILPVLDDMQRAIEASERSEDIAALREGERLVEKKFIDTLRQKNVVEIEAKGELFDENLHEAVARFAAGEENKGKVIDVIQRGYKLGDKVLRFAKVVVGE
ncbi:MAG: nucleotide exchange factor GrpE [Alistipes sp.]|nr:nucleotide exchange factor GrpE [Alistipes sp.]